MTPPARSARDAPQQWPGTPPQQRPGMPPQYRPGTPPQPRPGMPPQHWPGLTPPAGSPMGLYPDGDAPSNVYEPNSTIQARRGRFSDHRITAVHTGRGLLPHREATPQHSSNLPNRRRHIFSVIAITCNPGGHRLLHRFRVTSTNTEDTLTAPICRLSDCCVDRPLAGRSTSHSRSPHFGGKQTCSTQLPLWPQESTGRAIVSARWAVG